MVTRRDVKVHRDAHRDVHSKPTRNASNSRGRCCPTGHQFENVPSTFCLSDKSNSLMKVIPSATASLNEDNRTCGSQRRTTRVDSCQLFSLRRLSFNRSVSNEALFGVCVQAHKAVNDARWSLHGYSSKDPFKVCSSKSA